MRKKHLRPKDEVLIPSVCWSTSLWPLVQYNLKPIFVDANASTLNMDIEDLKNYKKQSNYVRSYFRYEQ